MADNYFVSLDDLRRSQKINDCAPAQGREFMQAGGHAGSIIKIGANSLGKILESPKDFQELNFYFQADANHYAPFADFMTHYQGICKQGESFYMQMTDATAGFESFGVIDAKIGTSTASKYALEGLAGMNPENIAGKLQAQASKDAFSGTDLRGFRIEGYQLIESGTGASVEEKSLIKTHPRKAIDLILSQFCAQDQEKLNTCFWQKLSQFETIATSYLANIYLIGSSLLLVYGQQNGELSCKIQLIDFANSFYSAREKIPAVEVDDALRSNHAGILLGVQNIKDYFGR